MVTELADGVFQLSPLPYVNVTAVRGADGWTLVDAAVAVTGQRLVRQLGALGIRHGDVERILLTHGHVDHAGGATRVRDAFGAREVLVGAADLASVHEGVNASGATPSPVERLPGPSPTFPAVQDATSLGAEVRIDDDRTLVVVPTPGHTDGHVAYHLPDCDLVLGGDTVFNLFRMRPSPGFLCSDAPRNLDSIRAIASLAPRTLQLAHGSPVTGDVAGRLVQLVDD